jgi:hypothetical protein
MVRTRTANAARWLVPVCVVAMALTGVAWAQSGRGSMSGYVLANSDVQMLPGATAVLTGNRDNARLKSVKRETVTDAQGQYSFVAIPYGDYTFTVSAPGYVTYEIQVYIPSDATTQIHVRLRTAGPSRSRP